MKKKALSLLLTLALCLSLLPTAAWATEDEGESSPSVQSGETHTDHPVCGNLGSDCPDPGHSSKHTADITDWTAISSESELRNAQANGHYYLEQDVEINGNSWEPKNGVVLCLNGNTLKATGDFNVIEIDNTTFTLTDCKNTGEVTHDTGKTGSGVYNDGGTFNMYGGNITKNESNKGGGVYNYTVPPMPGTMDGYTTAIFNMYGGSITGNTATESGGGVYNWGGNVKMYGGDIRQNKASTGGGVHNKPFDNKNANFYMSGTASIEKNEASTSGGGVYSERNTSGSRVDFTMSDSAQITGNTAATNGGGMCMNGGYLTVSGKATITANTKDDGTTASNVYLLDSGKTVKIDSNGSDFTGTIGVTTGVTVTENVPVSVANGAKSGDEDHFASDDDNYAIKFSNGFLLLVVKPQSSGHTDHYLCNGSSCTHLGGHTENAKTTFTAWNETDKLPDTAGSYYLKDNVTLSSTWEPVSGTVLCLNGKTVQASGDFDVITIGNDVTFTLTDCTNNGKITHADGTTGRGILINGTAVFNMYGGDITRNTSSKEGAGVNALGTFNMYGGSITNNTMDAQYNYSGGGVCVDSVYSGTGEVHTHTFNLYNGRIANDNQSSNGGGGVSVSSSNKFVMTGGSITGNICGTKYNGGGVSVYSKDPVFTVSGNVTITGNKRGTETNNVFLHDASYYWGSYISVLGIGDAGLASAARIGITTEIEPTSTKNMPAVFQNDTDYSANFFSDAGHYVVYNSTTKQLELSLTAQGHTHTWNKYVLDPTDHSRVLLYCSDSTCNASGGSVTVKAPTKLTYAGTPPRATVETSADWKGPEAGNITILYVKKLGEGSWTIFNTEPYTGTGTHYAYIRFLNNNNTIVEAYAEYDLVEKNDVTNKITFPSGQLTYTGSGLRYEKATISEGYNGKFTYTYWVPKGGSTGELDANGLPLAVGTYTVIATYEDDDNYGTARAILEVVAGSNNNNSSSSGGGGGGRTSYPVNAPSKSDNGTVTTSPKNATSGSTVTITVKPDEGYVLDTLVVTDSKGNTVKTTDKGDGKFSFVMPSGQVDVKATFTKAAEEETSPFDDVTRDDYYYDAVKWAAAQGVTGGTGNGKFSPADACTRAQIVTFLWRTAGSPAPKGMSSFTDVPADAYYAKAVAWAVENGITAGTAADKFSPDATCTRAHAVTFLFRLAKGSATGAPGFLDVAADAYYAQPVKWAVDNGITSGIGNGLFGPDNRCTRAQIVTFLYQADKI